MKVKLKTLADGGCQSQPVTSMPHFDDFLHFALDVEIGLPLLLVTLNPISFFSKLRLIFSSIGNMPSSELARGGTN
jgi:hypothetical protein